MEKLTDQEIFDQVATHLILQWEKSEAYQLNCDGEDELMCSYRGKNGLRCALGFLIQDSVYDQRMETRSSCGLIDVFPDLFDQLPFTKAQCDADGICRELQSVHDGFKVEEWGQRLIEVAVRRGLDDSSVARAHELKHDIKQAGIADEKIRQDGKACAGEDEQDRSSVCQAAGVS